MKVLFRADGSKEIGMGHLTRCADIADKLVEKDFEVGFLTKEYKAATNFLKNRGYRLSTIPISGRMTGESRVVNEKLQGRMYEYIIVDLLVGDKKNNIDVLQKYCDKLVYITDDTYPEEVKKVDADIVFALSPNQREYKFRGIKGTDYYIGPKYFPLKDAFGKNRVVIKEKPRELLVTLGGSDPSNNTTKVLDAINQLTLKNLKITVILGSASTQRENLEKLKCNNNIVLKKNPKSLLPIMLKADIAICSAGNTLLELMSLGIPTLAIPHTKREDEHATSYWKLGGILKTRSYGRRVSSTDISDKFLEILNEKTIRLELNNNSRKIIDGKGLERLTQVLVG